MNGYKAEVTCYGPDDEVLDKDTAFGNTESACGAAAGALRRQMENEHEEGNGIIGATVRA
jgi:hypothetical protein